MTKKPLTDLQKGDLVRIESINQYAVLFDLNYEIVVKSPIKIHYLGLFFGIEEYAFVAGIENKEMLIYIPNKGMCCCYIRQFRFFSPDQQTEFC